MLRVLERLGAMVLSHRVAVLVLLLAVSVVAAMQLPRLAVDNSLNSWFLKGDAELLTYRAMTATYGSDEILVVGIAAPNVFTPDVLERIHTLTDQIRTLPHVEKVFSLTSTEDIRGVAGGLEVGQLIPWPPAEDTLPILAQRALSREMYVGNIVNATTDYAAILVRLEYIPGESMYKLEATRAVESLAADILGRRADVGGTPALMGNFLAMILHDMPLLLGLMTVALIGMLWSAFRNPTGIALPLASVGMAALWALGWLLLAGKAITVVAQALPLLVVAVGVADTVHLVEHYQRTFQRTGDRAGALRALYRDLAVPCFLTSLTTAVGMLSLMTSRVRAVREFGLFAAIGVMGAFVIAMTLVPIGLSYARPMRQAGTHTRLSHTVNHLLTRASHMTPRHGPIVLMVTAVLMLFSLMGMKRIHTESGMLAYFKDSQRLKQETLRIEERIAGTSTIELLVDTGRENGVIEPETLHFVEAIMEQARRTEGVTAAHSVAPVFKAMRQAFFDDALEEYRLPESREEAAQYVLLYEMDGDGGDLAEYVNFDYSETRVSVRVRSKTATEMREVARRLRAWLDTETPVGVRLTLTGSGALFPRIEDYIRDSLVFGFSLAFVLTWLILSVYLRSLPLGAIAMIPNLVPVAIGLGFMGATGIALDTTTAMVASISIGLAVDDTIHFIAHVRRSLAQGHHLEHAFRWAVFDVGRAIVLTSTILCVAFTCMMVGEFKGLVNFGLLCNVTMITALPADLFLFPAVVRLYARRRHPEWLEREDVHPWPDFKDVLQPAQEAAVEPAEP